MFKLFNKKQNIFTYKVLLHLDFVTGFFIFRMLLFQEAEQTPTQESTYE